MDMVGKVSSFITQGMYSVATPFHPFGGAVDIIVVKQHDGTFRSTPWYVRFGKFQGVLKGAEKVVTIEVNGHETDFHMYLDNSGEAYFVREADPGMDDDEGLKDSDNLEGRMEDDSTVYSNVDNALNDFYEEEVNDFINEVDNLGLDQLKRVESDAHIFYELQDDQSSVEGSLESSEYGSSRYENLDTVEHVLESHNSSSEVVLVSVDGHILTAPISPSDRDGEDVQLSTPRFHLGPGEVPWPSDYLSDLDASAHKVSTENICKANIRTLSSKHLLKLCEGSEDHHAQETQDSTNNDKETCIDSSPESTCLKRDDVFESCLELSGMGMQSTDGDRENAGSLVKVHKATENPHKKSPQSAASEDEYSKSEHVEPCREDLIEDMVSDISTKLEISLCGNLLHAGMGSHAAEEAFDANLISPEEFKLSAASIMKNENLVVRLQGKYLPWGKVAHIILGKTDFDSDLPVNPHDIIPVEVEAAEVKEDDAGVPLTPPPGWRLWPIPFRRVKKLEHTDGNSSNEDVIVDSLSVSQSQGIVTTSTVNAAIGSPRKQIRSNVPTTDQIASLNLKEGQNMVNFVFSTRVLGSQKVEAHIYLWKWNTRIVISDVDGTITKSDVLGQFLPLVGRDWTHSGIAGLFSAIKENGYQLLFLSARAIVQAYLTKNFLSNLKQDGKSLPSGPVVISPDGLFPSLYREVIRRAPHEFKIACLEDIKALFPPDYNPFYAGFGNRDTDELSYRRIGIPKGKIFIINPKGEVAVDNRIDVKSYTSLHTLVHDMFPPTTLVEEEDFNSWNYWRTSVPELDR